MLKPNLKYWVTLTAEERAFLQNPVRKGKTAGRRHQTGFSGTQPLSVGGNGFIISGQAGGVFLNRSGNYIVSITIFPAAGGPREYRTFPRNIIAGMNEIPWIGSFALHE